MSERARIPAGLRGQLRLGEPMSRHTSWRAGGRARTFYQPADVLDLSAFLRTCDAAETVLFVGLGSNLLVRDGGFDGTVVFTHHALIGIAVESEVSTPRGMIAFRAGAGVPAPHLARFVAKHGGAGAEWMAGVPGTVGGALAMNAGCYGGETWNHVVAVETIDRAGGLRHREPGHYEVGYRHVRLKDRGDEWFVSAVFGFQPGEPAAALAHIRELLEKRVAAQPLNQPNAGSVFRNPEGDHAARLIEAAGLKGFTVGGAQVSRKHANFIVNLGDASAADIEAVIDHVHATVLAKGGVDLVREVRIVGDRA
ncbi:MAG TPA: UDP-N-acetylmuramate dehydrogenase [Usitatibacter sp.]|nr:UDP-N-acetylmuramate dehydrogenase [Usitatibacter sp.]